MTQPHPDPSNVDILVETWLASHDTFDLATTGERLCRYVPQWGWPFVVELIRQAPSEAELRDIAQTRGPLENLITAHGATFVGRIEDEARTNQRFKTCLAFVDIAANRIAPELWTRLADAAGTALRVRPDDMPRWLRKEEPQIDAMLDWDPRPAPTEPPVASAAEMATAWFRHKETHWAWEAVRDLVASDDLDTAWSVLLELSRRASSDHALVAIGAGPLEDWLENCGERVILRVEQQAAQDRRFRVCISSVWRGDMTEELWARVVRARGAEPERG